MSSARIPRSRKLACVALAVGALWSARASGQQATDLPLVIPHPQAITKVGQQSLVLGEHGRSVTEVVPAQGGGFFDEARDLIDGSLKKRGFAARSGSASAKVVVTTAGIMAAKTSAPAADARPLTPAEKAALDKSDQAYVIRMQPGEKPVIWIVGASPLGAFYGAATLVQLIQTQPHDRAVVANVEVRDYPDIPYRMCADWVLNWDWDRNCYDWGDGMDAFIARSKRKIDMCAQYKVNMVRFLGGAIAPGPDYMKERYPLIKRFALELNRYARRKGVALQYSSVSWGHDYCGPGLGAQPPWVLNRESYPDGKVYACIGGTTGSCLSNEGLTRIVAQRHKQLVADTEPGSIYLHHIDVDTYASVADAWKNRCPQCRQKYPDDEPLSPTGCAGAVANLYKTIVKELKSVKNTESGYDAARDLQIVFASPGYSNAADDDARWEKDLRYFQEIGRQLDDRQNVLFTFREQYKRVDNRALRTEEMARSLEQVGCGRGIFMFAIQGAGFYPDAHMLVSSPVLTETYRGAQVLYTFNGHVHGEALVLANVNYAWNYRAPGSVDPMRFDGIALRSEASQYACGGKHSDYLCGPLLAAVCAKLYGEKAAPHMADMFRLEREKGVLLPVLTALETYWKDPNYGWKAQAERNCQAKIFVDKALAVCDPDAKEDLGWLSKCLEMGARVCDFYDLVYQQKPPAAQVDAKATELLAWLDENFQFQKADPDGGDPGIWKDLIARARRRYAELSRRRALTGDGNTTVNVSSDTGSTLDT